MPLPFVRHIVTVPHSNCYSARDAAAFLFGQALPVAKYTRPAMFAALKNLLRENRYAAVQIEGPQLVAYARRIKRESPSTRIVLDWHNIESRLMARYAETETDAIKKFVANRTSRQLEALERELLRTLDGHIAVSTQEAQTIRTWQPDAQVCIVDNGVDVTGFQGDSLPTANRILFVGSMDYHANIDGVLWFASQIWPRVHAVRPDLKFTIVGRNPPPKVQALSSNGGIEVTGTVESVIPYYREALLSVVPLRVGGGSRLKILEAMAAKIPVVSTTLGAEGLEIQSCTDIRIEDAPMDFADAITELAKDSAARASLAQKALTLVQNRYDWPSLGARLTDFYQKQIVR